jgi:hypothetical protein
MAQYICDGLRLRMNPLEESCGINEEGQDGTCSACYDTPADSKRKVTYQQGLTAKLANPILAGDTILILADVVRHLRYHGRGAIPNGLCGTTG